MSPHSDAWIAALLLIAAHTTPSVVGGLLRARAAWPVDGGRLWRDGRRLLGRSKTWRGVLVSLLATTLLAAVLLGRPGLGAAFGALAMAGDLLSSFTKRRLGAESHAERPLLDQVPEFLLPLGLLRPELGLSWSEVAVVTAALVPADIYASRLWDWLLARRRHDDLRPG